MKPILLTMQAFGSYGEKTEIDFQKGGDFFLIFLSMQISSLT